MQAFRIKRAAPIVTLSLIALTLGCDGGDGGLIGDLAEECGLSCPAEGILQGNAQISGIASLDSFFGAVIDVQSAAASVSAAVRVELDTIALSVGLQRGAASADIAAAVRAKFDASLDGGLKVTYKPAECSASVEVAAQATAECDVQADPGSVMVECEGSCEVDATVTASCEAEATLVCEYTPPDLQCSGECSGTCQIEGSAMCSGTCNGTCEGTCSVQNADGSCAGECMGMCTGSCEMSAGASCQGSCEGTCTVRNPEGGCEANATARCEAMAGATVQCDAQCTGKAEPPMVKAECEATVEAKASASVECTPPELDVAYQWSAALEGDLQAQAQFKAWLKGFRANVSALVAAQAKAEGVLAAAQGMVDAAGGVVGTTAGTLAANGSLKQTVGAGCAVAELGDVGAALEQSLGDLTGSLSAVAEISGTLGAAG